MKKDVFQKKEITNLVNKIEKHQNIIKDYIIKANNSGNVTNAYWSVFKKDVKKEYTKIYDIYKNDITKILPKSYQRNIENIYDRVKTLKSVVDTKNRYNKLKVKNEKNFIWTNRNVNSIRILTEDALNRYKVAVDNGVKETNLFARQTQQKLITEKAINESLALGTEEGASIPSASNRLQLKLYEKLTDGNILSIVNKNGDTMHYKASTYADLVARTKVRESQTISAINSAIELETDLIQISSHNTTTPLCQEFEGKIFSISGRNKDFPQIDMYPPFHPNCLHSAYPVFEEALQLSGAYKQYSEFSNDEIDRPPFKDSFIPVKERA